MNHQIENVQVLGDTFEQKDQQNSNQGLYYQILGRPAFAFGDIYMNPGQKILADGNAMLWMDGSIQVETDCYGGCGAACLRTCSRESCCMNYYSGAGKISVGFENPGDMLAFGVTKEYPWLLTKSAFVAGTTNLKVSASFAGCLPCCCTDEGPFLTTIEIDPESQTSQGVFLAGSYGMLERHDIPKDKKLYVAKGNFFATQAPRDLEVTMIGGLTNFCCGQGWHSIVLEFTGPCTVYTQSRNPEDLRRLQKAAQAKQAKKQGGGAHGGGGGGGH
jgi:uncharacterized protein (AIM24 family)